MGACGSVILAPPNQGKSVWVVGQRYTIRVGGGRTDGRYALLECWVPPGSETPLHRHEGTDEAFLLLEGELDFEADGQSVRAKPGTWLEIRTGVPHFFRNPGSSPARVLVYILPAGLERFFEEVGEPVTDPTRPPAVTESHLERVKAAAPRYGTELLPAPDAARRAPAR